MLECHGFIQIKLDQSVPMTGAVGLWAPWLPEMGGGKGKRQGNGSWAPRGKKNGAEEEILFYYDIRMQDNTIKYNLIEIEANKSNKMRKFLKLKGLLE